MDDRALVEALLSRDPHAPRLLVERFQAVVFALCFRMMGHRQDAEDVAQETFVRALRGIAGFDPDRPVRPWLLGIAANRCRTALGKRGQTARPDRVARGVRRPPARPGRPRRPRGRTGQGPRHGSDPNTAWSSASSTNRTLPTRRSPRPSAAPSGR